MIVLNLPGWENSLPDHWQTILERQLGWARVQQTDWHTPKVEDWVAAIAKAIADCAYPPLIVTHSLGGIALARTMQAHPHLSVRGAFIVAPADVERIEWLEPIRNFAPIPLQRFPFPSVVVASTNDPVCPIERSQEFATAWGSKLVNVGAQGHISPSTGFGNWEVGKKLFEEFVQETT